METNTMFFAFTAIGDDEFGEFTRWCEQEGLWPYGREAQLAWLAPVTTR